MSKIHATDVIFATMSRFGGRVLASIRLIGITDMAEIMRRLREAAPTGMQPGLVTVSVRNSSAGWNHTQSILLRNA
ncbi:MAG: hypothetical protein K2K40_07560 [Paramuribaculum sp.]|nr:hypothetical protein [Candidatus Amulumruptor sp.]MDE6545013.1 hypothetical protein [Paramuribaculum sp.]MDE6588178.1 hypothetical protein [Paramuribaculum sp.]MDE7151813.1 hypothetical protein [Candidatus Amulumruptor sp.]